MLLRVKLQETHSPKSLALSDAKVTIWDSAQLLPADRNRNNEICSPMHPVWKYFPKKRHDLCNAEKGY